MDLTNSLYTLIAIIVGAIIIGALILDWYNNLSGLGKLVLWVVAFAVVAFAVVTFISMFWKEILAVIAITALVIGAGYVVSKKYAT